MHEKKFHDMTLVRVLCVFPDTESHRRFTSLLCIGSGLKHADSKG